jgi:hypothetical protein
MIVQKELLLKNLPLVLANPHIPELTPEEIMKVLEKLKKLETESRERFFLTVNMLSTCNLEPGNEGNPTKLTNEILYWAGRKKKKLPKYKESNPKMPQCVNGRVIKNPKGL